MIHFFQRLDLFFKKKGLNDNQVTIETGISNGLIGKARKRGALSQENISKILHIYPELNANWLFTGLGEMTLGKDEESRNLLKDKKSPQNDLVNLISLIISESPEFKKLKEQAVLTESVAAELYLDVKKIQRNLNEIMTKINH